MKHIKTKFSTILFFIVTFTINAQTIPKDSTIIILFDFRANEYDCDLLEKIYKDNNVEFDKGIDACGLTDSFMFNPQKNVSKKISDGEMKKYSVVNVKMFSVDHLFRQGEVWNDPAKLFKKMVLCEILWVIFCRLKNRMNYE